MLQSMGLQIVGHSLVTELTELKECGFLPQSIRLILALELLQQCRRPGSGFLGREDPLEKEIATHSSILAWRIPWTVETGRLQSLSRKSWT